MKTLRYRENNEHHYETFQICSVGSGCILRVGVRVGVDEIP